MISLRSADIKEFTRQLFLKETFDHFLLLEASFTTFCTVTIDGRPPEEGPEPFVCWEQIRPFALQLIKGKELPRNFRIVLRLSNQKTAEFLQSVKLPYSTQDIGGLYMNIRYQDKALHCTTGCSFNKFILDKSLEQEWDDNIRRFLRSRLLPFETV